MADLHGPENTGNLPAEIERSLRQALGEGIVLPVGAEVTENLEAILKRGIEGLKFARQIFSVFGKDTANPQFSAEVLSSITGVFQNSHDWIKRSELTLKILGQLRESAPEKMLPALKTMASYDGSVSYLREFLRRAGTYDPYLATELMRVTEMRADAIPAKYLVYTDEAEAKDHHGVKPVAVRSGGGLHLTLSGRFWVAWIPSRPESFFPVRRQGGLSIYRNWNPDNFSKQEGDERIKTRKSLSRLAERRVHGGKLTDTTLDKVIDRDIIKEYRLARFADLSPQQLTENPDFQRLAKHAPVVARDLEIYAELKTAIEALKASEHRLIRGESLLALDRQPRRLVGDRGGQLLEWHRRRIEAELQAEQQGRPVTDPTPDSVREAFFEIINPDIKLTPERERFLIEGLLAWQALKSEISKEVAFGSVASDIVYYRKLETKLKSGEISRDPLLSDPAHPIHHLKYNWDATLRDNDDILFSQKGTVPYAEAIRIIESTGVKKWRSAVNQWYLEKFESEFNAALEKFRPLFQEKLAVQGAVPLWRWREDSIAESVPLKRLKETIFGAPLKPVAGASQGVLYQRDFAHIMNALSLMEFSRDRESFCQALSIEKFEEMVRGVVLANRKVMALEQELNKSNYSIDDNATPELKHLDPMSPPPAGVPEHRERLITGGYSKSSRLILAEELNLDPGLGSTPAERLKELVARLELAGSGLQYSSSTPWQVIREELIRTAPLGLVPAKYKDLLESSQRGVSEYITVDRELGNMIDFAARIIESPLVDVNPAVLPAIKRAVHRVARMELATEEWLRKAYLKPGEVDTLKNIWQLKDQLGVLIEDAKPLVEPERPVKLLSNDLLIGSPFLCFRSANVRIASGIRKDIPEKDRSFTVSIESGSQSGSVTVVVEPDMTLGDFVDRFNQNSVGIQAEIINSGKLWEQNLKVHFVLDRDQYPDGRVSLRIGRALVENNILNDIESEYAWLKRQAERYIGIELLKLEERQDKQLAVSNKRLSRRDFGYQSVDRLSYFDPGRLKDMLNKIEKEYLSGSELEYGDVWLKTLKRLSAGSAVEGLSESPANLLISRELHDLISNYIKSPIGKSSGFKWQIVEFRGERELEPVFNFGRYSEDPRFDNGPRPLLRAPLDYLRWLVEESNTAEDRKEIAAQAIKVLRKDISRGEFLEWLHKNHGRID
ncbi:MAG: hypothetical protein D6719_08095 [Candidatus Dadabacteria bacterium]|nr:MAG: hypothetical protein D6719_08095 [Candidatus Dadabacteria bacterium]